MSTSRLILIFSIGLCLLFILNEVHSLLSKNTLEVLETGTTFNDDKKETSNMNESLDRHVKETMSNAKYNSNQFQAGMNVLVYGHPQLSKAKSMFLHLREIGVNSVAITFPFNQAGWQASGVFIDPIITPTILELQELIEEAHSAGLSVMLRPILDEQNLSESSKWRGEIEPADYNAWFDSYQSLLLTYAELAQASDIKLLSIGTEFNSLQNRYDERWIELIESIRHVYKGELTYSFNWDTVHHIPDNQFIKYLDYVGIDAYFPLDLPDGASVEALEAEWNEQMKEWKRALNHHSLIVTEAGLIPIAGAYRTPYSWDIPEGKLDFQAQANYYEATYQAWKPMIKGIYWWTVMVEQDENEIGYSPLNSSTERIIKRHFLKN